MANKSGFYFLVEELKKNLFAVGFKTVIYGEVLDTDINKQNIFPLAQIFPDTVSMGTKLSTFSFVIIGTDFVEYPKGLEPTDSDRKFYGQTNVQDVHQSMAADIQQTIKYFDNIIDIPITIGYPVGFEFFVDRFQNLLAGAEVTVDINIPNLAFDKCF